MKPEIHIRKAVASDLNKIEQFYNEVCDYLSIHSNFPGWKKGVYPVREDAEKGLKEKALYIAQINGEIAGTFILKHKPEDGYKNGNWSTENDYTRIYVIYTLAVHPDFLKQGVATEMLMFAERLAREEHCISIRLDVVKGNVPADQLYQKCGYTFRGTVSLGYEAYGLPWYNLFEKVL